jgi:cephalosporin-C deacetylase-like acetyl esterase
MPWFDLPLEQLRDYRIGTDEPPELDAWWRLRLDQARAAAREPALTRYEADTYAPVEVYAAYHEITAGKDLAVYPFTGHSVPAAHVERQLRHLREFLSQR